MTGEKRKKDDQLIDQDKEKETIGKNHNKKVKIEDSNKIKKPDEKIKEMIEEGKIEEVGEEIEKYLETFSNDGNLLSKYIEHLIKDKKPEDINKNLIEKLFSKYLNKILNVKLWRVYLKYVEIVNPINPLDIDKSRNIIIKSYKYAIDNVGKYEFFEGYKIFKDYLKYLKSWKIINPNDEETKMNLTRKVVKEMCKYPSAKLEENFEIWKKFETDINLNKGNKILNDAKTEFYDNLLKFNNEIIKITKSIKDFENEEDINKRQIKKWNEWIKLEKMDKLNIKNKNEEDFNKRIKFIYNLSTQYCRKNEEVWFNYGNYINNEMNKEDESLIIFKQGFKINNKSILLNFMISKIYENRKDIENVNKNWNELISNIGKDIKNNNGNIITQCFILKMESVKKIGGIKEVRKVFKEARQMSNISWKIFKEYAMMEYYINKEDKIATRVFLLGMQNDKFNKDIQYNLEYINFLKIIRDVANLKKALEECLIKFQTDSAECNEKRKCIYEEYFQFEQEFGDYKSYKELIRRYEEDIGNSYVMMRKQTDSRLETPTLQSVLGQLR